MNAGTRRDTVPRARGRWLGPPWVRGYRRSWLRGDVLAGVTVTAYLVPQVMAYAELAGLPPATGLWAAAGALLGYALLGTSRQLSVGPESTTALMTAAAIGSVPAAASDPVGFAMVLAVLVSALCLLGWVAHLDVLASLLSRPVLVGYMAGIAVVMVASQAARLTGIAAPDGLLPALGHVLGHLEQAHLPTLVLGLATLAAMLAGSALFPRAPVVLMGVLGATAFAAALGLADSGVEVVGRLPRGMPGLSFPRLSADAFRDLIGPALGIAFVGYTDNVLTGRSFAQRHGEEVDPRRELLALGAANLGAGVMQGFPVSSSGSRTAIADAVGVRSQLAGVITLLVTLIAVFALHPVLEAVPKAALGAVVVYAALRLVELGELRRFARFRRSEFVLAVGTLVAVLVLGVLIGVVVAITLSILDLLRRVARPHDAVLGTVPGIAGMHDVDDYTSAEQIPGLLVYRYDSPLFFANAEDFRRRAAAAVSAAGAPVRWFVLNAEAIVEVDITAADALEALRGDLESRGIVFAMARVKQDLRDELAPTGLLDRIGEEHVFPTLPTAVSSYEAAVGRVPGERESALNPWCPPAAGCRGSESPRGARPRRSRRC
jgi:SulP family sulfate permease